MASPITKFFVGLARKIPIDLGQRNVAETTEGKQIALRLVPDGKDRTALDIGCREGNQTRWLRQRGYEVTSIDVEKAFEDCQVVNVNAGLPFDDDTFDMIWCSEVLEHLEDPAASLAEMRRVTRPGGDIILTTPNSYAALFRAIAVVGLTPEKIQREDHIHFFDEADIRRLLPDAKIYGYFPYIGVKKTITSRVGELSPTFVMHVRMPTDN